MSKPQSKSLKTNYIPGFVEHRKKKGWFRLPTKCGTCPLLPPRVYRMWVYLQSAMGGGYVLSTRRSTISHDLGISVRQVSRNILELEKYVKLGRYEQGKYLRFTRTRDINVAGAPKYVCLLCPEKWTLMSLMKLREASVKPTPAAVYVNNVRNKEEEDLKSNSERIPIKTPEEEIQKDRAAYTGSGLEHARKVVASLK